MNPINIMLDLETWGLTPGSDIRSIGACVFDPVSGTCAHQSGAKGGGLFYLACENPWIEFEDRIVGRRTYPLTRDRSTEKWWNEQSPEAQAAFADPVDLKIALTRFGDWLVSVAPATPPEFVRLWSNGPHFDVAILSAVYRACQLPEPWHYRAPRDFRTIVDAANITRVEMLAFNHGTTHNALDDAISQAAIVCEAYKRLGLSRKD